MRHCEEAKPTWQSVFPNRESACCARHFDFLHKPNPNVPLYADGFGLFVLSAPLTSGFLYRLLAMTCMGRFPFAGADSIRPPHSRKAVGTRLHLTRELSIFSPPVKNQMDF